jgi:predicted nucleic acid-binding protein
MNAIDTNIFVYALDATEPAKQARAREFVNGVFASPEGTIIPWQVAVELLACLRRWESAGRMPSHEVQAQFSDFLTVWRLALPTTKLFEASFRVRQRHSLSHWDSLLIAACREAGVTSLYSEDMQHGADYDGVKIINPFAANPNEPEA